MGTFARSACARLGSSLLLAGTVLLSGCAATFDATSPAGAAQASNRFGFDLYEKLKEEQRNFVCSPVGAAISLSMVSAGARGKTLEEITRVLHVDPLRMKESHASFGSLLKTLNARDGRSGVALRVADRLWGDRKVDFEGDFLSLLRTHYDAPLESVDFVGAAEDARVDINRWGAEQTRGLIPEILQPGVVDSWTRLVVTNAVYFKGAWVEQFTPEATRERPFFTETGQRSIATMALQQTLRHAKVGGASLVELPYKGGLAMVVILPDEPDELDAVERRLASSYDDWVKDLRSKLVDLWLPRWRDFSSHSLGTALMKLGMPTAFGERADFTAIAARKSGTPPIAIDKALQRAFIEVDEIGTEAAAVTAFEMAVAVSARPPPPKPVVFHADHPFAYVIRDRETGAVLFAGRVVEP